MWLRVIRRLREGYKKIETGVVEGFGKVTERMQRKMENTFVYKYSAKENAEVQAIRKKYLPKSESKFEELKRLDETVQASGIAESLCVGIGGALILGMGLCLAMQVIGSGLATIIIGVVIGIVGIAGMLVAYPLYCMVFGKAKAKYAPRILELTAELTGEKNK